MVGFFCDMRLLRSGIFWTGLLAVLVCISCVCHANDDFVTIRNAGFEDGFAHWNRAGDGGMSLVMQEAARTGAFGLRVSDESETSGSSLVSERFPVKGGLMYQLRFYSRMISGKGIAVYLRFYKDGEKIDQHAREVGEAEEWRPRTLEVVAPEGSDEADIWIHSYNKALVKADFDDFAVIGREMKEAPPWAPTYKIRPEEKDRLTEADIPGPDGLVYPDWRMAGRRNDASGDLPVLMSAEDFAPRQGENISDLLREGIRKAREAGGGILQIPEGTFYLDEALVVKGDNTWIRGAGMGKTRLLFREHIPAGTLQWFNWADTGKTAGPDTVLEVRANPRGLRRVALLHNGEVLHEMVRQANASWGNRFALRLDGKLLIEQLGTGEFVLEAVAEYADAPEVRREFPVSLSEEADAGVSPDHHAAFIFAGRGLYGDPVLLAADAVRGTRVLMLPEGHGLRVGERIALEAPATPRWNALVGNQARWGTYRANQYEVVGVDGERVTLNQPLRIDFPVIDGAFVRRIGVLSGGGVEDFSLEQVRKTDTTGLEKEPLIMWYPIEDLWTGGITFNYVWDGMIRNVEIRNAGRNPVYLTKSKFCEIRDCRVDGALFLGNGGTGYAGLERSYDCLIDGLETHGLRHSPNVQWSASGNVIRNGRFFGSDAQWHAGWTSENLFENNRIVLREEDMANGAYGHAFYASGPDSRIHGPQGPRNVVYGNDVEAPHGGIYMLGGNEAWIIAYNRFVIEKGYAVSGKLKSFDHIIRNNVFLIRSPSDPAILFRSPNCTGIELVDNVFYGPIKTAAGFQGGYGKFLVEKGSRIEPLPADGGLPPKPEPPVESIYLWQKGLKN